MRYHISKMAAGQNGKVVGLMFFALSLVFALPLFGFSFFVPPVDEQGQPIDVPHFVILFFPVIYGVFGFLAIWAACKIYNLLAPYTGGFSFDLKEMPPQ